MLSTNFEKTFEILVTTHKGFVFMNIIKETRFKLEVLALIRH